MNRSYTFIVPFLLILVIATCEMATAIYTPSLNLVAEHFHVCQSLAQWSVSINLFGLALSGPFYGPVSDCLGRRFALRLGMGLFFVGSLLSYLTSSIEGLLLARFVQGIGAGVSVVVAFACVRDLFDDKGCARVLSYMGMAIALSPGCAPILGGYLSHHYGWQMCFAFVSVVAFLIAVLLFVWMPETLPEKNRSFFSFSGIMTGYKDALGNHMFLLMAMIPSFMIGGLWAFLSGLPVLFTSSLNVSIQRYGYYGFSSVLIYMIGTLVNTRLVQRYDLGVLLLSGISLCFISSCCLLFAGCVQVKSPVLLQLLSLPFSAGLSLVLPNGTTLAFAQVRERVGTSSALLGSLEMALGAVGVFLVGYFFDGSILSIAAIMLGGCVLSFIICFSSSSLSKECSLE